MAVRGAYNIRSIAIVLSTSIKQKIQLSLQRFGILLVVQRSRSSSASNNRMISLLSRSVRDRLSNKETFQLSLILCMLNRLQNCRVCNCANMIGVSRQSYLILILYGSAFLDSKLKESEVFLVEFEEGDVIANLI